MPFLTEGHQHHRWSCRRKRRWNYCCDVEASTILQLKLINVTVCIRVYSLPLNEVHFLLVRSVSEPSEPNSIFLFCHQPKIRPYEIKSLSASTQLWNTMNLPDIFLYIFSYSIVIIIAIPSFRKFDAMRISVNCNMRISDCVLKASKELKALICISLN